MDKKEIYDFVVESNRIEKIFRDPTEEELDEFTRFMRVDKVNLYELIKFIAVYQPDAKLRNEYGLNVRINGYCPPFGSPNMAMDLENLLKQDYDAYNLHIAYERLHPFTDCNGRSGRALWAWKNKNISGGFLLNFYFQTLNIYRY